MFDNKTIIAALIILTATVGLNGCATHSAIGVRDGAPSMPFDPSSVIPVIPEKETLSRYGNHSPYTVLGKQYTVLPSAANYSEKGIASWYGTKFHERRTSSWEPYDMFKMTAAHKSLPLPSFVRVTNLENNRVIIVRVNDRGPFHVGRIIDLSYAAAHSLGMTEKGTASVLVESINVENSDKSRKISVHDKTDSLSDPTQIYLQVGAFSQLSVAQTVKKQMREITEHPISIRPIKNTSNPIHRVLIGPLTNREQGESLALSIRQQSLGEAIIRNF